MSSRITRRVVQTQKEFYGRGPDRAQAYLLDDLVIVVMRGGFSRAEETLLASGRGASVMEQRAEFQEAMYERFTEIIADEVGRDVEAFMSANHQHPDYLCEIFVLTPKAT